MFIRRANVVFEYEPDIDIVFGLGDCVKKLEKDYNAKTQLLSLPKYAPPDAPRVIITLEQIVIRICLNRFDYLLEIPSHIEGNIKSSLEYLKTKINDLNRILDVTQRGYLWTGVVIHLEKPIMDKKTSQSETLAKIFDRLITIDRNSKDIASFEFKFGFKENNKFINYAIGGYEIIDFKLPDLKHDKEFHFLNPITGDTREHGIFVSVDINNRPLIEHRGAIEEFNVLVKDLEKRINDIPDILNMGGIL